MRRALADLRPIAKLYWNGSRRMLLAGLALSGATTLAGIGLLGLSGWFITATAIAGASAATALAFDVFAPAAGIRLLALTRTAARYGERLTTHEATLRVLAALRERLFRGWAAPSAAHRLERRPARLLFRLTADVDALDSLYLRLIVPAGATLLALLAVAILAGLAAPWLGALAAGAVSATALGGTLAMLAASRRPARRRALGLEVLRARTADLVRGQVELATAGRLQAQVAGIAAADAYVAAADHRLNRAEAWSGAATGIVSSGLLALVLVAGAGLVQAGGTEVAVVALAMLAVIAAFEPLAGLRRGATEAARMLLAARRIAPRLTADTTAVAQRVPPPGFAVLLDRVDVRHDGSARPVLDAVSLAVPQGCRLAVIGPSGAGKSTLLGVLAGELEPFAGSASALPSGRLVQRTELFRDTLADNLRLAAPDASDARLSAALAVAGLAETPFAANLDTGLGEGGAGISGGEARRLALARLVLHDAPLWLLDEPTEGLDGATARDVLRRIADAVGGRTLVIATHVRREAMIADRIAVLAEGRIAEVHVKGSRGFAAALAGLRAD